MTPLQQQCLDAIKQLNSGGFGNWFQPSEVMAFCQIESSFRPQAYRYEPRLGEASFGVMQVLASTAKEVGLKGPPTQMYTLAIGLSVGMTVAKRYWEQLTAHFGREPTYEEWSDSYNRGVGGVEHIVDAFSTPDDAYTRAWDNAQEFWAAQGVDG